MWEFSDDRAIYLQIMETIQERVMMGVYSVGEKLPSVRDLATEASVNPNTMQKALAELEQSQLLFSHRTSGRFITSDQKIIDELKQRITKEKANEFLLQMQKIGCSTEDTINILQSIAKENQP